MTNPIHVSRLTSHVSRLTSHVSRLTSHVSRLTSHVSRLKGITVSFFRWFQRHISSIMFLKKVKLDKVFIRRVRSVVGSSGHLCLLLPTTLLRACRRRTKTDTGEVSTT
jgi:hypothetical protein